MVTGQRVLPGGLDGIEIAFDDGALVVDAGLVLPATLCERLGAEAVLDGRVRHPQARRGGGARALSVVFGMLAGADCIDDIDRLRAGASGVCWGSPRGRRRRSATGCGAWASVRCVSLMPPPVSCLPASGGPAPGRRGW